MGVGSREWSPHAKNVCSTLQAHASPEMIMKKSRALPRGMLVDTSFAPRVTLALLVLPAAAALLTSRVALAEDPPPLKEGLWSIHSHGVQHPGDKKSDSTSTLCRTHLYDDQARERAKNMKDCSTVKEALEGNKYSTESICTIEGSKVDSKSTTEFRGTTTHTEAHVTYAPPLRGVSDWTLIQDQKYLGSCPTGAEGGDLMTPDGAMHHLGHDEQQH
jgi:hypothetical protein